MESFKQTSEIQDYCRNISLPKIIFSKCFHSLLQVLEAVTEVREAVEGEKEILQRQIVEGSRILAKKLEAEDRKLLVKMCDDVDEFTKSMTQLRKKAQVNDSI